MKAVFTGLSPTLSKEAAGDTTQQGQVTQQHGEHRVTQLGRCIQKQETSQTERCEQQGKKHPQKLQNAHPSPTQQLFSGLGKALGISTCWGLSSVAVSSALVSEMTMGTPDSVAISELIKLDDPISNLPSALVGRCWPSNLCSLKFYRKSSTKPSSEKDMHTLGIIKTAE